MDLTRSKHVLTGETKPDRHGRRRYIWVASTNLGKLTEEYQRQVSEPWCCLTLFRMDGVVVLTKKSPNT